MAAMTNDERREAEEDDWSVQIEIDCYDRVLDGVPILLQSLGSPDMPLRRAAAYAIGWFPEADELSVPALQGLLDADGDPQSFVTAILSLGLLSRHSARVDLQRLLQFLTHSQLAVRVAAAVACAREPLREIEIDVLIEGVMNREKLAAQTPDLLVNEGDLTGYAGVTLSRYGAKSAEKVVTGLCQALESADAYQSLNITKAILDVIVDDNANPIRATSVQSLSFLQRYALEAICDYGGWKMRQGEFGNYIGLVRAYGLPYSQQSLRAYLDGD